jgi:uncharacterized protein
MRRRFQVLVRGKNRNQNLNKSKEVTGFPENFRIKRSTNIHRFKSKYYSAVFHSTLGNLRFITNEVCDKLFGDESQIYTIEKDVLKELEKLSFINYPNLEERKQINIDPETKTKCKHIEDISTLRLIVTTECNLDCGYCFQKDKKVVSMNKETVDSSIEFFKIHSTNVNKPSIRFFGGEPLLRIKLLLYALKYKIPSNWKIILNTNGTLIDNNIAELLKDHNVEVVVSLDGVNQINDQIRMYKNKKGSFRDIKKSLLCLLKYDNSITINVTLGSHNMFEIQKLIDYIYDLGINNISINPEHYSSNFLTLTNINILCDYLHELRDYAVLKEINVSGYWVWILNRLLNVDTHFCSGIGYEICINPFGEIYPCPSLPISLGNVNKNWIINNAKIFEIRERKIGSIESCNGCIIEGMCLGGCAGDSYISYNDYSVPADYFCNFSKKLVETFLNKELFKLDSKRCIR